MKKINCPCCENESSYNDWHTKSNDDFAICPICDNTCTYDEFPEGDFN